MSDFHGGKSLGIVVRKSLYTHGTACVSAAFAAIVAGLGGTGAAFAGTGGGLEGGELAPLEVLGICLAATLAPFGGALVGTDLPASAGVGHDLLKGGSPGAGIRAGETPAGCPAALGAGALIASLSREMWPS